MNKNIRIAKELVKIAKSLVAFELDNNLFNSMTAKNACKYIMRLTDKYTHDVWNNEDKSYEELNFAKKIIEDLGMNLVNKEEHVITDQSSGSWKDVYHYEFINNQGTKFTIAVKFNVMLAGTVSDRELSYDFTVSAQDENTKTNILPGLSDDDNLNHMSNKRQVADYIRKLVDPFVHNVWNNEDKSYRELNQIYDIIHGLGMQIVDVDNHKHYERGQEKGNTETLTCRFMNYEGKIIEIYINIITAYAGTVDDIKSRYDVVVLVN